MDDRPVTTTFLRMVGKLRRIRAHIFSLAYVVSWLIPAMVTSGCSPGATQPHVVLISIDTLRADHLGCYGYKRRTSPQIDRLAAGGMLFERAYSTTSWTLPAHHSLFTGLPVSVHGVCDDRFWRNDWSADHVRTIPLYGNSIAECFSKAGYSTAGFYSWKYLDPKFGFGQGFDIWNRVGKSLLENRSARRRFQASIRSGVFRNENIRTIIRDRFGDRLDDQRPTSMEIVDSAITWIEHKRSADNEHPMFIFLHFFDVHSAYVPPSPYDSMFDPNYRGPIDGRHVTSKDSRVREDMPLEDLRHLVALYDGEIAWVDSQIGRFMDFLREADIFDSTLVILTSDHGEEFFEHGHKTHRHNIYRETMQIPLIIRYPGVVSEGLRVPWLASIIDIAPTLLGFIGLPNRVRLPGLNLIEQATNSRDASGRVLIEELTQFPDGGDKPIVYVGLRSDSWHRIRKSFPSGRVESRQFDLEMNPEEVGNGRILRANDPGWNEMNDTIDKTRVGFLQLRAVLRRKDLVLEQMTAPELSELKVLGYSGSRVEMPDEHEGGVPLCMDGCYWW